MDDQRDALWADASLRRPAVDPGIPRPDRDVLAARGALLPLAVQDRPARRRYYLPTEPARRLAAIDGTVVGLTAAGLTALFGTTPLAVGVLIFQGPASWEMASNRFALLAAGIIAMVTTVILGVRVVRFGQPSGRTPAETAARTHHGRYLTGADFDARSRVLLRRAQDAIDAVTSSLVCRDDLLDRHATSAALTGQEWDIAVALREQAQLRARRAELRVRRAEWPVGRAGPQAAALLSQQDRAAQLGPQAAALLSQQDRAAQLAEAEHYPPCRGAGAICRRGRRGGQRLPGRETVRGPGRAARSASGHAGPHGRRRARHRRDRPPGGAGAGGPPRAGRAAPLAPAGVISATLAAIPVPAAVRCLTCC